MDDIHVEMTGNRQDLLDSLKFVVRSIGSGMRAAILETHELDRNRNDWETAFLTAREQEEIHSFRNERRKKEWLGARVCLKLLLAEEGLIRDFLDGEVARDLKGRPGFRFLKGRKDVSGLDCSLSHKDDFAAAAVSRWDGKKIGIDIEKISDRFRKIAAAFVHPHDRLSLSEESPAYYPFLWSLKEAASKALGLGLTFGMKELVLEEKADGCCRVLYQNQHMADAVYYPNGAYALAVSWSRAEEAESLSRKKGVDDVENPI